MDPLILTIIMRGLERLLVVLGGGLAIYLGYRLFLDMPGAERGSGKVNLPGGISIYLSRVGPGVFFSLFGAIVIGLSLHYGIAFNDSDRAAATGTADAGGAQMAGVVERSWSGMGETVRDQPVDSRERLRVIAVVAALNRLEGVLPNDLKTTERITLQYALRDARERLLLGVWNRETWGDPAAFRAWIEANEPDPPAAEIAEAVRLYHEGRAGQAP